MGKLLHEEVYEQSLDSSEIAEGMPLESVLAIGFDKANWTVTVKQKEGVSHRIR